jgi:DNA polymerase-3 subunit gamma/tau
VSDPSLSQHSPAPSSDDRRALYLRWRPLSFADVVGQEHVVRTLRNAVSAGTPAHAYLFAGPRGTGKTSVARILYRAVNCTQPRDGDPCGQCGICRMGIEGRTLDLVEIDAASNRGIDDIRELREKVAFSPTEARFRVYIVDEAHELTAPAWDAFLKTLEEPPPHAIFVLATTEAHKVPTTIVSRCQRFDFRRIKAVDIAGRLLEIAAEEGIRAERPAAERLARMARGGLRDAISLLDQAASFTTGQVDLEALREVLGLSDLRTVQKTLEAVARGEAAAALQVLVEVAANGLDLRLFADDVAGQLRGLLYARAGASQALAAEVSAEELAWFEREAPRWDPASLNRVLAAITDGLARIRDSGQFQLHLELALLQACGDAASEAANERQLSPPSVEQTPEASGPLPRSSSADQSASPHASNPEASPEAAVVDAIAARLLAETDAASNGSGVIETGALGLDVVRDHWPRVIDWVARRNPLVADYLRPAELRELRDGWLVLAFAYKVHHQRVADDRNRDLVEQACGEVIGRRLRLRCERVQPNPETASAGLDPDDPVLKYALDRFGGQAELLDQ